MSSPDNFLDSIGFPQFLVNPDQFNPNSKIFNITMEKEEQLNNLRRELLVSYLMQETGLRSELDAVQCLAAVDWNYNKAKILILQNDNLPRILHPTQCNQNQNQQNQKSCQNRNQFQEQNCSQQQPSYFQAQQNNTLKVHQPTNSPSSPSSNLSRMHQPNQIVNDISSIQNPSNFNQIANQLNQMNLQDQHM